MRVSSFRLRAVAQVAAGLLVLLAGCANSPRRPKVPPAPPVTPVAADESVSLTVGVMPGIDVFEQQGFRELQGKRVGLLTHPAAVNRFGVSTLDVLRRDKRVNLVALFSVEHGIHGLIPAGEKYEDHRDERTGLPVYSLYSGRTRSATPAQLRHIDVLVIDLQDIGTRSYTFVSAMLYQLEACFQNDVEVVVLDRPNPLGGLKVSGPINDAQWLNYLGASRVPYVHGLTIGEFARMAASEPGVLRVSSEVRQRGRLTIVPMRGWRRAMTWPQTGMRWVPTSPNIPNFEAVVGYPMTGLGAQLGGFRHGIGTPHPFRLLTHAAIPAERLAAQLTARQIPGLAFSVRQTTDRQGRAVTGVYVDVVDWQAWRPTELGFVMMQMAAATSSRNPFAAASSGEAELFNKHVGSTAWWNAIRRDGARVRLTDFWAEWEREAQQFQQRSRQWWLYQP